MEALRCQGETRFYLATVLYFVVIQEVEEPPAKVLQVPKRLSSHSPTQEGLPQDEDGADVDADADVLRRRRDVWGSGRMDVVSGLAMAKRLGMAALFKEPCSSYASK